ncbi:Gfo/Idh/MocA family protein [Phytoactinopolyspora halotolerans]|uniref:Gfo/Idh/MocA family oxidoreductase n=1 Tax=Phytoactinopolyspora halotolerans TaxID=1981512 RepID=A0A6L9SBV2_9ACTN|nr:Gfo/Idh/MocA family oxidoreductase [Phytoactinopolyspora halotolerans]NEE01490.1 Gfo/Idh/MocA family oxidoreductase [Phytoactinopolyspora halotolerans]
MSPRSYRTAIVGTGGIATAHARAMHQSEDRARLLAVVDVDGDRARAFADTWSVPRSFASLSELLLEEEVDLVHVCTPPQQHAPMIRACLKAGTSVLVEKPPALSLAEVDELLEAERRSSGRVGTVFQHRFGPAAIRLRRMAAAGELGRPLLATCATQWYRDDAYFEVAWRGSWESEGGGPTMGHGIHQFDLLLSVLGEWQEVSAVAVRSARQTQTEDISMALVTFDNDAVASVVNSVVSPRETSALRFDYQHATVELEHLYGYSDADWTVTAAPGHDDVATRWAAESSDVSSGHDQQLAAVLDALDAGTALPVSLDDARTTMEFIAALYASAFTGQRVRRGDIGPHSPFYHRMDGSGAPWAGAIA